MLEIRGHFDGETIVLDEPFGLKPNTPVIVKVLTNDESADWLALGKKNFAKGYSDDEPEYSLDKIKHFNPDYEGIWYCNCSFSAAGRHFKVPSGFNFA